jgi:hypothetical protein
MTPSTVPIVRAVEGQFHIFMYSSSRYRRSRSVRRDRLRNNALAVLTWSEIRDGQPIGTRPVPLVLSHGAWRRFNFRSERGKLLSLASHPSSLCGFARLDDAIPALPIEEQKGIASGSYVVLNAFVKK